MYTTDELKDMLEDAHRFLASDMEQALATYALAAAMIALVERLDKMTADVSPDDDVKLALRSINYNSEGY